MAKPLIVTPWDAPIMLEKIAWEPSALSFATKPLVIPAGEAAEMAWGTGKSDDAVLPAMIASPCASTVMAVIESEKLPPKKVEYSNWAPSGLHFTTNGTVGESTPAKT